MAVVVAAALVVEAKPIEKKMRQQRHCADYFDCCGFECCWPAMTAAAATCAAAAAESFLAGSVAAAGQIRR